MPDLLAHESRPRPLDEAVPEREQATVESGPQTSLSEGAPSDETVEIYQYTTKEGIVHRSHDPAEIGKVCRYFAMLPEPVRQAALQQHKVHITKAEYETYLREREPEASSNKQNAQKEERSHKAGQKQHESRTEQAAENTALLQNQNMEDKLGVVPEQVENIIEGTHISDYEEARTAAGGPSEQQLQEVVAHYDRLRQLQAETAERERVVPDEVAVETQRMEAARKEVVVEYPELRAPEIVVQPVEVVVAPVKREALLPAQEEIIVTENPEGIAEESFELPEPTLEVFAEQLVAPAEAATEDRAEAPLLLETESEFSEAEAAELDTALGFEIVEATAGQDEALPHTQESNVPLQEDFAEVVYQYIESLPEQEGREVIAEAKAEMAVIEDLAAEVVVAMLDGADEQEIEALKVQMYEHVERLLGLMGRDTDEKITRRFVERLVASELQKLVDAQLEPEDEGTHERKTSFSRFIDDLAALDYKAAQLVRLLGQRTLVLAQA